MKTIFDNSVRGTPDHSGPWFCNSCGVVVETKFSKQSPILGIHISATPWEYEVFNKISVTNIETKNGPLTVVCRIHE